jgi:hypothetical protein
MFIDHYATQAVKHPHDLLLTCRAHAQGLAYGPSHQRSFCPAAPTALTTGGCTSSTWVASQAVIPRLLSTRTVSRVAVVTQHLKSAVLSSDMMAMEAAVISTSAWGASVCTECLV